MDVYFSSITVKKVLEKQSTRLILLYIYDSLGSFFCFTNFGGKFALQVDFRCLPICKLKVTRNSSFSGPYMPQEKMSEAFEPRDMDVLKVLMQ